MLVLIYLTVFSPIKNIPLFQLFAVSIFIRLQTEIQMQNLAARITYFPYQPEDLFERARRLQIV
jgi:hypothetical protein